MKQKIDSVQDTLKDRYKILGVLGEGGMSTIYKALDLRLNSNVAIKVLHHDPQGIGALRLQREAQTSARLSSINIARVFNFGQTSDGSPYMVMELLDGVGLDVLIKQRGRLGLIEAAQIFKQISKGLSDAHQKSIIHRDLKPSNIFLVQNNDSFIVKILDFGIAQIESDQKLTRTGALLGSPIYMSPEQIECLDVDERSDIYSFGCLMFETLTGQAPFKGNTALETMAMHKKIAAPLVSELVENLPDTMVQMIEKCLQKQKELRPQSVFEIEEVLDQILNVPVPSILDFENSNKDDIQNDQLQKPIALSQVLILVVLFGAAVSAYFGFQILNVRKESNTSNIDSTKMSYEQIKLPVRLDSDKSIFKISGDSLNGLQVKGGENVEDDDLESLSLEKIVSLQIHSRELSGRGLRFLKNSEITQLKLENTNITSDNLKYLADLPKLNELVLHSPHLDDRALDEIARIKSLLSLSLDAGNFSKKGISSLAKLENLTTITFIGLDLADKDIEPITGIKSLNVVRLINCKNISPAIGIIVARLPKLTTIFINKPLSKASYQALSRTKLKAINLKNRIISPSEFCDICSIKSLWRIGFINARVTDDNYSALLRLPNLVRFEIARTLEVSDSLVSTLSKSKIQQLDISSSALNQDQLEKLLSLSSLEYLYCANCTQLDDKLLEDFANRFQTKHHKPLHLIKSAMY